MLRITTTPDRSPVLVTLEGRLAGPWVDELRIWWESECLLPDVGALVVDMSDVAFIDGDGRALLEWMYRHGVELRAHGCMTRAVRDEIVEAAERKGVHGRRPAGSDAAVAPPVRRRLRKGKS
jgi:anti-anti-sigma regulatory factor